jgi:hypothetical protein
MVKLNYKNESPGLIESGENLESVKKKYIYGGVGCIFKNLLKNY